MKDYESKAAEHAERIVKARTTSAFVTDEVMQRWIETALMAAFHHGRSSVYQEEMLACIKKK